MAEPNAFYDGDCMYPLANESDSDFESRLAILRAKRRATMTEEDIQFAKLLAEGKATPDMLKYEEDWDGGV